MSNFRPIREVRREVYAALPDGRRSLAEAAARAATECAVGSFDVAEASTSATFRSAGRLVSVTHRATIASDGLGVHVDSQLETSTLHHFLQWFACIGAVAATFQFGRVALWQLNGNVPPLAFVIFIALLAGSFSGAHAALAIGHRVWLEAQQRVLVRALVEPTVRVADSAYRGPTPANAEAEELGEGDDARSAAGDAHESR